MKKTYTYFSLTGLAIILTGCFTGNGIHNGSIKAYKYLTKKENLQRAVMRVIQNDSNIYRDTSLDHLGSSPILDNGDSPGDHTAGENFYNDIKHYVTIKIKAGEDMNEYTFRYYGPDEDWKTSDSSEIFVVYAYDKYHAGGSEWDGKVTKKMAKYFTDMFEKGFVSKLDKELNLKHSVEQ
jgi:hypothetical protein